MPSLSELEEMLDALLPEDNTCTQCGKKNASIEVKCSCSALTMKTCAHCMTAQRDAVKRTLIEHAADCDEAKHVLSAFGF